MNAFGLNWWVMCIGAAALLNFVLVAHAAEPVAQAQADAGQTARIERLVLLHRGW
ncbi:hypothetical protein [Denitromonas sp.]|uniref:hypothetical protein n=1 Tax=Denitromonas sp. TaxID=2734609 RepID=UPI002AFE2B62|nr:hypothetical protein [Denitromonas sp.]